MGGHKWLKTDHAIRSDIPTGAKAGVGATAQHTSSAIGPSVQQRFIPRPPPIVHDWAHQLACPARRVAQDRYPFPARRASVFPVRRLVAAFRARAIVARVAANTAARSRPPAQGWTSAPWSGKSSRRARNQTVLGI